MHANVFSASNISNCQTCKTFNFPIIRMIFEHVEHEIYTAEFFRHIGSACFATPTTAHIWRKPRPCTATNPETSRMLPRRIMVLWTSPEGWLGACDWTSAGGRRCIAVIGRMHSNRRTSKNRCRPSCTCSFVLPYADLCSFLNSSKTTFPRWVFANCGSKVHRSPCPCDYVRQSSP